MPPISVGFKLTEIKKNSRKEIKKNSDYFKCLYLIPDLSWNLKNNLTMWFFFGSYYSD